jgi:hypothetical protein
VSDPTRPGRERGTVVAALAQRDYRRFFLGGLLNQVGMWCFNIAAGLLVYEMTRSTLLVGAINFACSQAPCCWRRSPGVPPTASIGGAC